MGQAQERNATQPEDKENIPPGDPVKGAMVFKQHCAGCHDIQNTKQNRAGPYLMGLWGREASTVPGYKFKDCPEKKGVIWNEKTLSDYMDGIHIPGTKMMFRDFKTKPEEKADVIAYLKEATDKKKSS